MRKQFPNTVAELMKADPRIVVLLGDIGVFAFSDLMKEYPTRIYNVGICEQAMVGVAAGLALAGFVPIVHTIEPFLVERAFEQIKNDFGYQGLAGTFIGVDVSQSGQNLGYTHECPYALEMMKFVIGMKVFEPKDATDFSALLKENYSRGLNYFRIK